VIEKVAAPDQALSSLLAEVASIRAATQTIDVVPFLKSSQARCKPVKLDEQAVSRFILGPLRLKNQLMRFANMDDERPLAAYVCPSRGS
jgi:hypothetical protein